MLRLRWIHKITNAKLEEIMGMTDVAYFIKKLESKSARHVAREKGEKWNQKILHWRPYDKSRDRGRPPLRWRDEIIAEMGPHWQRRAQNKKKRKTNVEAYAQKWAKMGRPLGPPHQ